MTSLKQLELDLLVRPDYRGNVDESRLETIVRKTLRRYDLPAPIEVGLVITDDREVADLNRRYRGKQGTTDVLSFSPNDESATDEDFVSPPDGVNPLGEVIVSYPQAERQAREHGHAAEEEVTFLIVHGLLHLLGYDHEVESEALIMREQETAVLAGMGIDRAMLKIG